MGRKSTGSNPMVLKWAGSPQVPVLQYFQIHRSYQNGWSFSISRFTGHTRMLGPSVFPDSQVLRRLGPSVFPDSQVENPVLRFQNIHFLKSVAKSESPDPPIRSVSSSQYRRIPRGLKLLQFLSQKYIFLWKIGKKYKIPHFYRLWAGFIYSNPMDHASEHALPPLLADAWIDGSPFG